MSPVQQLGLLLTLASALYVPHNLHNRMMERVKADSAAAEATIVELDRQAAEQEQELLKAQVRQADIEKELQDLRETQANNAAKLTEVQQGDCGTAKVEAFYKQRRVEEHSKIVDEAEPRLHQLELEAQALRAASQEEATDMEAQLPPLQHLEEELRESKVQKQEEVQLGQMLRDNDSTFVRQWAKRVLTMDLFMGPFMLNKVNLPILGHGILIPKWNAEVENIGKASQDLLDGLPKMDPFLRPRPVLYRTCAVVGTSGMLLYYSSGKSIDAHDAVFRFNSATTQGFEDFVGSKTTVRFTDRANFGFSEQPNEIVMQLVTNPHTYMKYVTHRKEDPSSHVFMVAPEFHLHVVSDLAGPVSPAFYGVLFALQRCQQVDLYGFARGTDGETPYHYYNAKQPEGDELKRGQQEASLIKELLRRSEGRMNIMEPCVLEEDCEGQANCQHCAQGSHCVCGIVMPVAKMGFCMESGVADCFYACDTPSECPGGELYSLCSGKAHSKECAGHR